MILKDGTVDPELERARQRGVYLDSCHGLWHFNFTIARLALAKEFKPAIISTDFSSVNVSVIQSLPVTMSIQNQRFPLYPFMGNWPHS